MPAANGPGLQSPPADNGGAALQVTKETQYNLGGEQALWSKILHGKPVVQAEARPVDGATAAGGAGVCAAVQMDQEYWAKLCAEHALSDDAAGACQAYFKKQVEAANGSFKPY